MSSNSINREVVNAIVDRWAAKTSNEEQEAPRVPIMPLLGEAADLAELIDAHYESVESGGKTRLGLDSVAGRGGISADLSTEIRELQIAAGAVHSRYNVLVERASSAPIERAETILTEMRAALSFALEDGEHPTGEEQLDKLREAFGATESHDGLALALEGYSELASQYIDDLQSLGGFDVRLVDEALQRAQALRQRSADRLTGRVAQDQRDALRLRNRLFSALSERMRLARRAFRFVFRDTPEIVRKAGSEYQRKSRSRSRKARSDAPPSGITGTENTLEMMSPPPAQVNRG